MSDFANWFQRESMSSFVKKSKWLEELSVNDEVRKEAVVLQLIRHFEETGYAIYVCEDEDGCTFKIAGVFPFQLLEGQTYLLKGKVSIYRGEKQVLCQSARLEKPTSRHGVIAFLKTLHGLNKKAEKLFDLYGADVIEVLIKEPMRVANEVSGIGKKSVMKWQEQLKSVQDDYRVLSALLSYGISMKQAKKLFEKFKSSVVDMIDENPYFLADEVKGYGFMKCDDIARNIGYDPKSENRIQQGLLHVLKDAMTEGHCYLPRTELLKRAKELLDFKLTAHEMMNMVESNKGKSEIAYKFGERSYMIPYQVLFNYWGSYQREKSARGKEKYRYRVIEISVDEIADQLRSLEANMRIVAENENVYLTYLYLAEKKVAKKILRLLLEPQEVFPDAKFDIDEYLQENGLSLEEKQYDAVSLFSVATGGMFILNGSAGCGKTFTLKVILAILERQYKKLNKKCRIKIFAPTGKASKVAKKATGRDCSTVHRGLKFIPGEGFEHDENNPLDADVLVLDESSMLDILLAQDLFDAIPAGCKVIFMGDTKQLPSVGAGNVLHDLIQTGMIPVVTLNVVKRQGLDSGIIVNANRIIDGEMISSALDTKDSYVINKQTAFEVQDTIVRSIERLMTGKEFSLEDIQVLCPQKNGEVGTYVLNWVLQQAFNPNPVGEKILNRMIKKKHPANDEMLDIPLNFQTGDKVIHISNNYQMLWYQRDEQGNYVEDKNVDPGITNGESGVIEEIRKETVMGAEQTTLVVRYEDGFVIYNESFDELDHAYALTIHKSQGSQWPAVLMPILKENHRMLNNSIFYTGFTRAKDFVCIIGQAEAIAHAIRTFNHQDRYTTLEKQFLPEAS